MNIRESIKVDQIWITSLHEQNRRRSHQTVTIININAASSAYLAIITENNFLSNYICQQVM